ncbi:unnamed protein product [Cladocopium goreaui]|uniref:Neutral alpha-glucosidase C n=1 Tax=Cladocopium goreaui TaxID=2562237 RepID=A0A9P1CK47_9DINO|nr:unnamed protein product [Cladocopium goreaui]
MPLRCLVVDCGGVTHPDSGLKEAVRKRVASADAAQAQSAAAAAKAQWSAMRDDPRATKEDFWQQISVACGLESSAAAEADAEICATLRGYYPESLEVLRAAKEQQVVLGMISNHLSFWFHKECGTALEGLIDQELLLVSSEVACSKPGPEIFQLFLERLGKLHPGLTAADCVFVDDKAENVAAAQSLGFQGLLYDARKAAQGDLAKALKDLGLPL